MAWGEKRECRSVRVEIATWASWGRVLVVEVEFFMISWKRVLLMSLIRYYA